MRRIVVWLQVECFNHRDEIILGALTILAWGLFFGAISGAITCGEP